MRVTTLLALTLLAGMGSAQTPPASPTSSAWKDGLADFARKEGLTVLFEVPARTKAPAGLAGALKPDPLSMRALGWLSSNDWQQVEGVQAFRASWSDDHNDSNTETLHKLLHGFSSDQIARLGTSGLSLSNLDEAQQRRLFRVLGRSPEYGAATLSNFANVRVLLTFEPTVSYVPPGGEEVSKVTIGTADPFAQVDFARLSADATIPSGAASLVKRGVGKLEFEEGGLLPLEELLAKAEEAFGRSYAFDRRFARTEYFVAGRFDQPAFEKAMAFCLQAKPFVPQPALSQSRADLLRNLFQGPLKTLVESGLSGGEPLDGAKGADFVQGKSITAAELWGGSAHWKEWFGRKGIAPDAKLKLGPGVTFSFTLPNVVLRGSSNVPIKITKGVSISFPF